MLKRTTPQRSRWVSRFVGALFDHASRILVLAKCDKLRMSQPIDLRFILHPFMA